MSDSATVLLKGDNDPLKESLKQSESMLKSWGTGVTSLIAGLGIGLALKKAFDFGKASFHAAEEVEQSMMKLDAVLKATGNTTGLTRDEIEELGAEMQKLTKYDDDATRSASTLFAQMGNIRGDIFKQGIKSAADLAASLGTDLPGAASILGRALAAPERGMLQLRRAGVIFTQAEKERIKTLMEGGKITEAQQAIIDKLGKTVGGQAAKQVETFTGQWQQFQNRIGDIMENIGGALMPLLLELMDPLEWIVKGIEAIAVPTINLIKYFVEWGKVIVDYLTPTFEVLMEWLGFAGEKILEWGGILLDNVVPVVKFMGLVLVEVAKTLYDWGVTIAEWLTPIIVECTDTIIYWAKTIWEYVKPIILTFADIALTAFTVLQTGIQNFADISMIAVELFALAFVRAFNQIVYVLTEVIPPILQWFGRNWKNLLTDWWQLNKTIWMNIYENIKNAWDAIMGLFRGEGFNFEWKGLTDGFKSATEELPKIAERVKGDMEKSLENDIGTRANRVGSAFRDNLNKNKELISGLGKDVMNLADKASKKTEDAAKKAKDEKNLGGVAPPPPTDAELAGEGKDKKDGKGGAIEDLLSLNKRISEAAGAANKEDKALKATQAAAAQAAADAGETKKAIDKNTAATERVAAATESLAAEAPLVGALADG